MGAIPNILQMANTKTKWYKQVFPQLQNTNQKSDCQCFRLVFILFWAKLFDQFFRI